MADFINAIILGVVEGITEFLPISSTGHLIIVNQFVKFSPDFTKLFDIFIQLGAILAILVYFFKRLWPFSKDAQHNKQTINIWSKALVGVLPAIILGAIFADKIEEKLFNPLTVSLALVIGGAIILIVEKFGSAKTKSIFELSYKTALFIGLIQCLSMIPGTSRSGATIIGALILGANRVVATEFSFFLAIPTMIVASGYSLLKYFHLLNLGNILILATGFIVSFIVAILVIKLLLNYIKHNNFKPFGWYRIALGLLILILLWN